MFVSALNDRETFVMKTRDAGSTSDETWRSVWGKEAAAINPLAAVNQARNASIQEAIRTNDWSAYHNFQAKQHPAWYDKVNGDYKPNKVYYGNLIDTQHRSLQEAIAGNDEREIAKRKARLEESIADFKNAPGEVPHVVAFAKDPELAAGHGIGKPSTDWYNSPYNNALVASQGRFQDEYWYENAYFIDHPKELAFALEAVQQVRPDIAKIAAKVNAGAYERSVASTTFAAEATKTIAQSVIEETVKEAEKDIGVSRPDVIDTERVSTRVGQTFRVPDVPTLGRSLLEHREQMTTNKVQDILLDQLSQNAKQRKYQLV
ncbi:hypothetical protein AB1K83_08335 [Sporosarcina sp. 179-K 3D1 HS]|uniref:hypothetical protein n=1 Tax=Sporosarcina sp. 179-K 3D1 HS TaxID=3232169 RepID=UPI0039A18D8A